jgi:hypothetical protein
MRDRRGACGAAQERVAGRVGAAASPVRTRSPPRRPRGRRHPAERGSADRRSGSATRGAAAAFLFAVTSYGDPGDDPPTLQSGGAPILLQTAGCRRLATKSKASWGHFLASRSRLIVGQIPALCAVQARRKPGRAQAGHPLRAAWDVAIAELTAQLRARAGMRRRCLQAAEIREARRGRGAAFRPPRTAERAVDQTRSDPRQPPRRSRRRAERRSAGVLAPPRGLCWANKRKAGELGCPAFAHLHAYRRLNPGNSWRNDAAPDWCGYALIWIKVRSKNQRCGLVCRRAGRHSGRRGGANKGSIGRTDRPALVRGISRSGGGREASPFLFLSEHRPGRSGVLSACPALVGSARSICWHCADRVDTVR